MKSAGPITHIADVRSAGRLSKHHRVQILGRETVTDRDAEQVDDLFGVRSPSAGAWRIILAETRALITAAV